jgi:hypothetical protein
MARKEESVEWQIDGDAMDAFDDGCGEGKEGNGESQEAKKRGCKMGTRRRAVLVREREKQAFEDGWVRIGWRSALASLILQARFCCSHCVAPMSTHCQTAATLFRKDSW